MSETRDLVYRANGEVRVLEELREWATFARQAGIVPANLNAYQIMTVIQAGREVGIPPLQALRSISMIGGRVVMSVQLQLSLARGKGVRVAKLVDGDSYCEVTLTREGESITVKYTLDDARRAGLIRQGSNWEKYPRQMLRWRAIGDALRIIAPDAVAGFLSPEEAEAIPPIDAEVVDVTPEPEPEPQPRRPRRQAQQQQANGNEPAQNGERAHRRLSELSREEVNALLTRRAREQYGMDETALRDWLFQHYRVESVESLEDEVARTLLAQWIRERQTASE